MSETLQFKTELKQLLHLIINSLYSHKDIFLRELVSNASDAIDTVRFESLTKPDLLEGDDQWKIKIIPDDDARTLTISDNGVGMSKETIVDHLGTIAKSGTRTFLERLKSAEAQDQPELIGQFGVGFYSAFMVADKVTVVSRMAGSPDEGVRWESDGQGEYTVETVHKDKRGTDVILHLREEDKEFLSPFRIRQIIKKYSDFVAHPIVLDVEKEDDEKNKTVTEETLNAQKAIWLRSKSEITEDEYNEFYKHLTHDTEKPLKTIHYNAEGAIEFKSLLYLPARKPFDLMFGEGKKGLQLYIQRVFIMDECEALLPMYLRFVRGVVDSPDLPLNVSREILQQSAPLEKIKSNLTKKILSTLEEMQKREFETYVGFFQEIGVFLKEGVTQDWAHRDQLADLLVFESTKTEKGKFTTLAQYVERMPDDQKEIYFLTGENRSVMEQTPYLESFRARGWEVLLMTDPVDDFVAQSLHQFKEKALKAVDQAGSDTEDVEDEKRKEFQPFLDWMKEKLPEVKEIRLTKRLKESAVCLVAAEGEMGANFERMMQRFNRERETPTSQRILEVNPDHPTIQAVAGVWKRDPADSHLENFARILYDLAVVAEGSKVQDPLAFSRRINEMLVRQVLVS